MYGQFYMLPFNPLIQQVIAAEVLAEVLDKLKGNVTKCSIFCLNQSHIILHTLTNNTHALTSSKLFASCFSHVTPNIDRSH